MEIYHYLGFLLSIFAGISLGMLGSGGSVLLVPVFVYVMGIEPTLATAYSLFVVGATSLVGGFQKAKQNLVDFKKVLLFGIPTVVSVFITRISIIPKIPNVIYTSKIFTLEKPVLIMIIFALLMIIASIKMINPSETPIVLKDEKLNYYKIQLYGVFIGLLSGFVGAGGGFLIIPVLLFSLKTPMKMAVGTSLFIVASQSLLGFLGDIEGNQHIDWNLLILFTICSIIGIFIGNFISKKINGSKLKTTFGWFVFVMGIYIIIKEFMLT